MNGESRIFSHDVSLIPVFNTSVIKTQAQDRYVKSSRHQDPFGRLRVVKVDILLLLLSQLYYTYFTFRVLSVSYIRPTKNKKPPLFLIEGRRPHRLTSIFPLTVLPLL